MATSGDRTVLTVRGRLLATAVSTYLEPAALAPVDTALLVTTAVPVGTGGRGPTGTMPPYA